MTPLTDALRAQIKAAFDYVDLAVIAGSENWRTTTAAMKCFALFSKGSQLRALLTSLIEQTERPSTHAEGCWDWGPKHYECALAEIDRLEAAQLRLFSPSTKED